MHGKYLVDGTKKATNTRWLLLPYPRSVKVFYLAQLYIVLIQAEGIRSHFFFLLDFVRFFFLLNKFMNHFTLSTRNTFYLWTYSNLLSMHRDYGFLSQSLHTSCSVHFYVLWVFCTSSSLLLSYSYSCSGSCSILCTIVHGIFFPYSFVISLCIWKQSWYLGSYLLACHLPELFQF